jgi:hypothetical protein
MVIVLDKPDYLNFIGAPDGSQPVCKQSDQYCGTKAALSALDGLLAAEKEAFGNITIGPKLAIAWSMNEVMSMDKSVAGEGVSSFRDIESVVEKPDLVGYKKDMQTSLKEMQSAFDSRWVHALDTQSPWVYLKDKIVAKYDRFKPKQWFIANFDYAVPEGTVLTADLDAIDSAAGDKSNPFMGVVFSQFQFDYAMKTGVQGLFGLGTETVGHASPCWIDALNGKQACTSFDVLCLNESAGDPGRADAVRKIWHGVKRSQGLCNKTMATLEHVVV